MVGKGEEAGRGERMRGIDPEIREYIRRINSYPGVRTSSSCQGHAEFHRKPKRIVRPDGKVLKSWVSVRRPYVSLRFADSRRFGAFSKAIARRVGKGIYLSIGEKKCHVAGKPHTFEEYFYRRQKSKLMKQLLMNSKCG